MSIQPPILDGHGPAPTGVCSRWMAVSPCGAAGTWHVIWDSDMTNGCACEAHAAEARRNWVYIGLHPYSAACASPGVAEYLPGEDRCVLPDDEAQRPDSAAIREMIALDEELGLYEA